MKQTQRRSTWDEQETQNFLRAYCEDPNNWQIVASKVGTRTPYQVMRFAKKYFNMIQRDEQIRRNNRSIRDYRYCKHNRPAPPGMQIVSSKIKAIKKILREKPELTSLEEAALKAYQDARTNREAMRLGLELQPDESQRPKRARTARRPQEPGRVGRSLGPRPRSRHDDYKEVRDAESEDQGLFERYRPSRMQARMSIDEEGEERDDDDA